MVHLHKNYTSRKKYNDIALLELTENVIYDNAVLPGININIITFQMKSLKKIYLNQPVCILREEILIARKI